MRPTSGPPGKKDFKAGLTLEFLQGDYRQLVHELDEAEYQEIRLMVMEIRNAYVRKGEEGRGGQKHLPQAVQFLTKQTWSGG